MKFFLPALVAALTSLSAHGLSRSYRLRDFAETRRKAATRTSFVRRRPSTNETDVQELFFTQWLDHFRSDSRTFEQRFFYSDRYAHSNATTDLALLCVGGEGPDLDRSVLVDSVHCSGDMLEFAKTIFEEYRIHLFALEHRYYGRSYPNFGVFGGSPVSNANLVYLSSRQALADLSRFVSHQNRVNLSPTTRWITFGGSYPGMLSAWARLKFPHLITAAVSSSAPIEPRLDFAAYNDHVAESWADPHVGGSDKCLQVIEGGHAELAEALEDESHYEEVAEAFAICDPDSFHSYRNKQLFLGDGVLEFSMQGNNPACNEAYCNVNQTCQALVRLAPDSSNLNSLSQLVRHKANGTCNELNWDEFLGMLADPYRGQKGGWRSWLWQTCTEFGFYQTCEFNSSCPFARGWHPLEQDLYICQAAFDVSSSRVMSSIEETRTYYGGWDLAASHVLSMTGSVDPWSELAFRDTLHSKETPLYNVPGASHHFWTHPPKDTDAREIEVAREIIFVTLREWLTAQSQAPKLVLPLATAI